MPCKTYHDCTSNIAGVFAQCGCTYSDTQKRCDILHSNTEYQDYIEATISFQRATAHCHNARILESGPCDKLPVFRDMMCKKMKAYYYLPNYGADFCLLSHSNQYLFSEIDETQLWCSPNRYSTLLGLSQGFLIKVGLTSLALGATLIALVF